MSASVAGVASKGDAIGCRGLLVGQINDLFTGVALNLADEFGNVE